MTVARVDFCSLEYACSLLLHPKCIRVFGVVLKCMRQASVHALDKS